MGIVYSSILMFPEMKLAIIFFPIPFPAYIFGVGYLIYTLFNKISKRRYWAYGTFGGAIGGIICTLVFDPFVFEKSFYARSYGRSYLSCGLVSFQKVVANLLTKLLF